MPTRAPITELYIITGASRGLGLALAQQLLRADRQLLTISRNPDVRLEETAQGLGAPCEQWGHDLAEPEFCVTRLESWLRAHSGGQLADFESATLINNAGLLGRIGPLDAMTIDDLSSVVRVNLEAPLLLTRAFLRATRTWGARRRVLNIASGAGRRPMAGWAAYSATKAALDHVSRVIALDEELQSNPARIVSLAPGVMDTDMQAELRAADSASFPRQSRFVELHQRGELPPAKQAAQKVLAYLERPDFGTQPVADLRSA